MKKLGLISFHHHDNYGSMLQAFALQKTIEDNGIEAEYIDFVPRLIQNKSELIKKRFKRLPYYINNISKIIVKKSSEKYINENHCRFEDFYHHYIKVGSKKYFSDEELVESTPQYGGYLVGSDQVWNPNVAFNPDSYYLSFVPKGAWCGTYAPSIAVNHLNKLQSERLERLTQHIKFLSCRENTGSIILEETTKRSVKTVLDPTLLMDRAYWEKYSIEYQTPKKYLLQYILGENKEQREWVRKIAQVYSLCVLTIPTGYDDYKEGNFLRAVGPGEFLWLIRNASIVCTDSFHATAFSVNFNTPFFAFNKFASNSSISENSRIEDFLDDFHLRERLVTSYSSINYEINKNMFVESNKILSNRRNESKQYLQTMLDDYRLRGVTNEN